MRLVYINAGHDVNGNPKRGWILFAPLVAGGNLMRAWKFFQEDYSGFTGSVPLEYRALPCTERMDVSAREFGSARKLNNPKLGKLAARAGVI